MILTIRLRPWDEIATAMNPEEEEEAAVFPGNVSVFRNGRLVWTPEAKYFFLALTLIVVPSALFFGFTYVRLSHCCFSIWLIGDSEMLLCQSRNIG